MVYTGCQWKSLVIEKYKDAPIKEEISFQAVYYHHRKWSRDGIFKKAFEAGIKTLKEELNLSEINLDGSHTLCKKGGQSAKYQGRKKPKRPTFYPLSTSKATLLAQPKLSRVTIMIALNSKKTYRRF